MKRRNPLSCDDSGIFCGNASKSLDFLSCSCIIINMRRLKQIALVLTVILGGLLATDGVYALQFSSDPVPLTFTYNETMTLTLAGNLALTNVAPGQCVDGGTLTATVATNGAKGYTLSAKMNGTTTTLAGTSDSFSMLGTTNSTLSAGNWGIRVGSGSVTCTSTNYTKLNASTGDNVTLNKTTNVGGTAASGYTGTNVTNVRVGAYAKTNQLADTYTNTILFTAVTNS